MTKITLHDSQEPFTPNRDRSEGFYRHHTDEPAPVAIPAFLKDPEPPEPDPRIDLQAARIAELEAELEAQKARSTDMFDAADLTDLIRESEPHAEAQRRWRLQYTQLNNRLVDTRLPPLSEAERALLNRLQRALYSGRRGAVETV